MLELSLHIDSTDVQPFNVFGLSVNKKLVVVDFINLALQVIICIIMQTAEVNGIQLLISIFLVSKYKLHANNLVISYGLLLPTSKLLVSRVLINSCLLTVKRYKSVPIYILCYFTVL